jgi:hypothetical protein
MQKTIINNNLKDEQYYIDLYDQYTVEECYRLILKFSGAVLTEEIKSKYSVEAQIEQLQKIVGITLNCFCGERYTNKAKTIQEWMDKDRRLDEFLGSALPSKSVLCTKCSSPMNYTDKHLYGINGEGVLFFFHCNKCCKNRAFYDNGEEFKTICECPKCGERAKAAHSRKKNKITTKYKCSDCEFTESSILDLDEVTEKIHNEGYLAAKKQFCLSKEDGEKYLDGKRRLIDAVDCIKELKGREKQKDLYDSVAKVKKLNIADIEKLLSKPLQKEGFIKLNLENPQISRDIKIEFTVQDTTSGIHEHDRKMKLKKTINKALIETNWKLIDDYMYYKLGIITGRLRGLESEEDLVKLVQARQEKLDKVK